MNNKAMYIKKVRRFFEPLAVFVVDVGLDPRRFIFLINIGKFLANCIEFISKGGKIGRLYVTLSDYNAPAGQASGHYFHQDLRVASLIFEASPSNHLDIGSRIDGFVAHVASYRQIDLMDVRPVKFHGHKNIRAFQADLMDSSTIAPNRYESISCLHAIEHFGLGRYGDTINPDGHKIALKNIIRTLKAGGTLYISFPIGSKTLVCFNAYRVFNVHNIFNWCDEIQLLKLRCFDYVDDAGDFHPNVDIHTLPPNLEYGCGIYTFDKLER